MRVAYATSLQLWYLENSRHLMFAVRSVRNKDRAMIRSEIKREAFACNWEGSLKCKSVCSISRTYAYKCVLTHLHNFAAYISSSRVGNKALNVEYVITGDVRLCACSGRSTVLSLHSKWIWSCIDRKHNVQLESRYIWTNMLAIFQPTWLTCRPCWHLIKLLDAIALLTLTNCPRYIWTYLPNVEDISQTLRWISGRWRWVIILTY